MHRFAMTVTSKGQVTLPAEYRRAIGAVAGDRLSLLVDSDGRAILTKESDDLSAMKAIARRAHETGARSDTGPDPVGDYLLAEDARTMSDR